MHRIYCPDTDFSDDTVSIDSKDELHHLRDVLRLKKNADVRLFNGRGDEARGTILSINARQAAVEVGSVEHVRRKGPALILACAIPKKNKFELIIEKATELGADEIIPLKTERTEVRVSGDRLRKKKLRYQTVAVNASKQSQRAYVPVIHPVTEFRQVLAELAQNTTALIPSLTGQTESLLKVLQKMKASGRISFLIGPEGDFTAGEYDLARKSGCRAVTLGETVLKVETAAICALSCAHLTFRS